MPMKMGKIDEAISKAEFHAELRSWHRETDESTVSDAEREEWPDKLYVADGDQVFEFHADTKREAVAKYLKLVDSHGDGLEWALRPTRTGKVRAVAFGPDKVVIDGFYLYKHR